MKKSTYLAGLLAMAGTLGVSAQTTLYTTAEDFAQFGYGSGVTSTAFYSDSSAVNAIGNQSAAGGAGTAGSLQQTTVDSGWGATSFIWLPDLTGAAWQAFDPGYSYPNMIPATGTIRIDVYTGGLSGWSDCDFVMQGNGMGWTEWHKTDALSQTFTGADGNTWNRYFYNYTLPANNNFTWAQIGFQSWGDIANVGQSFYVDNIQVQASAVPEPGTAAFAVMGSAAFLFLRRRTA